MFNKWFRNFEWGRAYPSLRSFLQGGLPLAFTILLIEFFDELHYGVQGAVLPALRLELALSYTQVGLYLGLPHITGTLIEPLIMLLGDTPLRRRLILGGGLSLVLVLLATGLSRSFPLLLLAATISFPASGAFVSLAQATLMDLNPGRESQMMARWTVFGSAGNLIGPLLVAGGFALALGWRWVFFALALLALGLSASLYLQAFPGHKSHSGSTNPGASPVSLFQQLYGNVKAILAGRQVIRWVLLLELSDLLLDIFTGYVILYLTDVMGLTPLQASAMFSLLMFSGFVGDLVLIPLLEHLPGRGLMRVSAAAAVLLYPSFLLAPWVAVKIGLLLLVRLSTIGWYQVLQGEAYASAPGRSGTVMALTSFGGILAGLLTWIVGWVANQAGLPAAMWLLLAGPLSLVLFVPPVGKDDA